MLDGLAVQLGNCEHAGGSDRLATDRADEGQVDRLVSLCVQRISPREKWLRGVHGCAEENSSLGAGSAEDDERKAPSVGDRSREVADLCRTVLDGVSSYIAASCPHQPRTGSPARGVLRCQHPQRPFNDSVVEFPQFALLGMSLTPASSPLTLACCVVHYHSLVTGSASLVLLVR